MRTIKKKVSGLMKWVFALLIFIFVMTVNYSEAEGNTVGENVASVVVGQLNQKELKSFEVVAPGNSDLFTNKEQTAKVSTPFKEPVTLLILSLGIIGLQANRLRQLYQ